MSATDSKTAAPAKKGVQVHATISAEKFDALEDHRWTVRLNMVDLVKLALDEYGAKHNLPAFVASAPEAAPAPEKGAPAKA
jgi:hypothetical protein